MYWVCTSARQLVCEQHLVQRSVGELVAPFTAFSCCDIPVRYYRRPPVYFHGWRSMRAAMGRLMDNTWYDNHRDRDRWNHSAAPARATAPLPMASQWLGQPLASRAEQQMTLQTRSYRYEASRRC